MGQEPVPCPTLQTEPAGSSKTCPRSSQNPIYGPLFAWRCLHLPSTCFPEALSGILPPPQPSEISPLPQPTSSTTFYLLN